MSNNELNYKEVLARVELALQGTSMENNEQFKRNVAYVLTYSIDYDLGNVLLGQLEELSYHNPDVVVQWLKYTIGVTNEAWHD